MFSEPKNQRCTRFTRTSIDRKVAETFGPRLPLAGLVALGVLGMLATASCGRRGDPRPPSRPIPAATSDLTVLQRGKQIILEFGYPTTTTSGRALPGIDSVEVWEYLRPLGPLVANESDVQEGSSSESAEASSDEEQSAATIAPEPVAPVLFGGIAQGVDDQDPSENSPFGTSSATRPEEDIQVDGREFSGAAQQRLILKHQELSSAISGARIFVRLSRGPIDSDAPSARIFAVRTTNGEKLISPYSNRVTLIPVDTPASPKDLKVVPGGNGVEITWLQGDGNQDISGYRVYRRDAQSPHYSSALITLVPTANSYRDTSLQFGNRYIYTVTTVLEDTPPIIESSIGEEFEVNYVDRFAPDPPLNLVVFANAKSVRLLWEQTDISDVAGYRVLRRGANGDSKSRNQTLLTNPEFIDSKVKARTTYFYQVVAVDLSGNISEPSEEIEARVP